MASAHRLDQICARFEDLWKAGQQPRIEDHLGDIPEPKRGELLRELLRLELHYRRKTSEILDAERFRQRFPEHVEMIRSLFGEEAASSEEGVDTGPQLDAGAEDEPPSQLGRYRITAQLGAGAFGVVYQAYDAELQRDVAIKVPHRHRVATPADAEAYLAEARVLASLDHPGIVPAYDLGRIEDGLCYVVSKFVAGTDLRVRLKQGRPSFPESAAWVLQVAEALHHAHRRGLVHRDIKPANLLLDSGGQVVVADFGLALRDRDFGAGPGFAGTPAYMSPEQARGEGHRVDARSDVYSLGVVFYELLTGRRPFTAAELPELLEHIKTQEPRPPRQLDETVPRELDRICLKTLSKRAADRYSTAADLAEDLRYWQAAETSPAALRVPSPAPSAPPPVKVVPRGLRSFESRDADFFLELVPGPRDRDDLPESIRFWKDRLEETDADQTFSVGLLYGPSGCGKSSLVKAGLLPRLAKSVTAVYVEATADETEARVHKGLRRQVPGLPGDVGLIESLAALRRGQCLEAGQKVLLVLDQFEQWLHARRSEENTELVQALRHCDGGRLQGVVLVRDDFWLAVSRFMKALEVEIVEGRNSALVDLFDPLHARKVLAEFGRAYGRLPDNLGHCSQEQDAFLDRAVSGLAQEGKVISVRLALFAEMVKGKPWTPATLAAVGGTEGVGVTFLDETFTAATAPPSHRLHQKAAQAVLKSLLPEAGTDIKGHMRSEQELLDASGYASRPRDFHDLLRILDGEIRLITPTDPEGKEEGEPGGVSPRSSDTRYYQLTHDYLVPSLRNWLTRKQRETRRGRAELLLADRASVWTARPENRQLPALRHWLQIRWLTARTHWTPPQRKMMAQARRYHALRGLVLALMLVAGSVAGWLVRNQIVEQSNAHHAAGLVQRLLDADTAQVPGIVAEMESYRNWTDALLRDEYQQAKSNSRPQLHASLALLPVDPDQVEYLYGRLLDGEPHEVPVIRDFLAAHQSAVVERLWTVVEKPGPGQEPQRLRAAATLATYDPDSPRWEPSTDKVVEDLVSVNALHLGLWTEAFRPIKARLLAPLAVVFRQRKAEHATERSLATNLLVDYAADQPAVLADLLLDADAKQFAVIYRVATSGPRVAPVLSDEIDQKLAPDAKDDAKEKLAKRQANAAVALLKMNQPAKVWPLLKHSADPRVRSYLIDRLSPLGADAKALVKRLDEEPDVTIRRALLLSLGEYGEKDISAEERQLWLPKIQDIYRRAADPGLHGAAEWLLRTWLQEAWLKKVNDEWAKDKDHREKASRAALAPGATLRWYVNGQGQTMVVISGPMEFLMGSPLPEADRNSDEAQHPRRIGRTFALAATSVTKEQFLRFLPKFGHDQMQRYPDPSCPIGGVIWYEAAAYCNWLSQQEDIAEEQWCYETNPQGRVTKLKANYLSRTGYRLPTEAEMEYATRAGALTSRYYGETEELLPKYAWYDKNARVRTWPVGMLKPNDLGLFDTQGNVNTWCQERYRGYPQAENGAAIDDKEDIEYIKDTDSRVWRGGSFSDRTSDVRSADRYRDVPANRLSYVGFRPARTLIP